jgi:hypothetical protein
MFANISQGTKGHTQLHYDDGDDFYSDDSGDETTVCASSPGNARLAWRLHER